MAGVGCGACPVTEEARPFPIDSLRASVEAALAALPAGQAAFIATTQGPTIFDEKRTAAVAVMVKTKDDKWSFATWAWTHSDRPVRDLAAGFEIRHVF